MKMKTLAALSSGVLALIAFAAPRAHADTVSAALMGCDTANCSWQLYATSFRAGDAINIRWRGYAHLRLSLYKPSGEPVADASGAPITLTYPGTPSLFGWSAMQLSIPTDIPDAILVVKNAELGFPAGYTLSIPGHLQPVNHPLPYVTNPRFQPLGSDRLEVSYPFYNLGPYTASEMAKTVYVQFKDGSVQTITQNQIVGNDVPAGTAIRTADVLPASAWKVMMQVSSKAFGETFIAGYAFFWFPTRGAGNAVISIAYAA